MPAHSDSQDRLASHSMAETVFSAAIGAALMLYFGWGVSWFRPADESTYSQSILGFIWLLRIGGILMAVAAAGLWLGLRPVLIYDSAVAMVLGLLMLLTGAIWLANSDMQGLLLLVFGALFFRSGWGSWETYRALCASGSRSMGAEVVSADSTAPVTAADPAARQAALDRLLAAKRRETPAGPAAPATRPGAAMAQAPTPTQKRHVESKPEEVAPATKPAAVRPVPPGEAAPEGFLAELGRDDGQRK